jgi:hypothetical protein
MDAVPPEVLVPPLAALVKWQSHKFRVRIHAGKVAALVKVPVDACEAEVAIVVRATVFEGAYVFDVKSGQGGESS